MTRVLVTGASGTLGRALLAALQAGGYHPVAMSRRPAPAAAGVDQVVADLATGAGLERALDGVDVVVHAATSPTANPRGVDVEGTARLLDRARRGAGVAHLVYPSIIGVDEIPYRYYRYKLAAERLIADGEVPFSMVRVAQFHPFVEWLIGRSARLPVLVLPLGFKAQPVDVDEVAARLVRAVSEGPSGRLRPFAGPEVLTLGALARTWLEVRAVARPLIDLPVPGAVGRGFRRGRNTDEGAERGSVSWRQWLERKYPPGRERLGGAGGR